MEIHNKKDFTSAVILTSVWAVLSAIFFVVGPLFIGAVFACSTLISGYYTVSYYINARKEQVSQEAYEAAETIDIDN